MANITFTFGSYGVKIVLLCPAKEFPSIRKEFFEFLSSLKIDTDESIPEIREVQDTKGVYLRYNDMGIFLRSISSPVPGIEIIDDEPKKFYRRRDK